MLNNIKESSDGVVQFFEDTHKYIVKTTGKQLISVSTLIKNHYAEPFDPDGSILRRCAKKEGVTPEELKQRWEDKKNAAASKGTAAHLEFEYFIKTGEIRNTKDKDIVEQFALIRKEMKGELKSEEILYDLDYGIAGCTDLIEVIFDEHDVNDFKTNEKLSKFSFGKKMKFPLNRYDDCTFQHYVLQLNIYSYLYEKMFGTWPRNRKILWINPKRKIEVIDIPNIRGDVVKMLNHYKQNFLDKSK